MMKCFQFCFNFAFNFNLRRYSWGRGERREAVRVLREARAVLPAAEPATAGAAAVAARYPRARDAAPRGVRRDSHRRLRLAH